MRDCLVRKANRTISHAHMPMCSSSPSCRRRIAIIVFASTMVPLVTISMASCCVYRRTAGRGVSGPIAERSTSLSPVARYSAVYCEEKLGVLMKRVNWVSFEAS